MAIRALQPGQRQGLNRATAAGNQQQYLANHPGVQTHMNKVAAAQQGAQRPQSIASPGAIQGGLGGGGAMQPPPQGSGATGSNKQGGGGQQGGAQGQPGQQQPMQGPMGGFSQFGGPMQGMYGGNMGGPMGPYGGMSREQLMANMPAQGQTIGYTSPMQQQWNAAMAAQQPGGQFGQLGGGLGQMGQQANLMSQLYRQGGQPGAGAGPQQPMQGQVNPQQMQALLQALGGAMGPR